MLGFMGEEAAPQADVGSSIRDAMGAMGGDDPFSGMSSSNNAGADTGPSALKEWESKHAQELDEIAAKESADKRARREKANEELAKFNEDRAAQAMKRVEVNRASEKEMETSRTAALQPGANAWEMVASLIDTNARTADESSDTSRMRSLLIQLKTNPMVTA